MRLRLKNAWLMLPLLVTIAGCGLTSSAPAIVTDTYRRVYEPVCFSRRDTDSTVSQITDNEVVFKRLCPNEAKNGDRKCDLLKKATKP